MSNKTLIEDLYRFFKNKDYPSFIKICHSDLKWIQNPGFPRGSTYNSPEEVVEKVFKAFDDTWSEFAFTINDIMETESAVIVTGEYYGTHAKTGKSFSSKAAHLYYIEKGKIKKFQQYADTKTIWDAIT